MICLDPRPVPGPRVTIFITGGCGFIGSNLAAHYLARGDRVVVFDNLSRRGAEANLAWLRGQATEARFAFVRGDVRRAAELEAALPERTEVVCHLAGQVAVTTSVADPRADFQSNALGTLNVLEAVRRRCPAAIVINASTNKVYGRLEDMPVAEDATRYRYLDRPFGIGEDQPLDFYSPYGCSKGCGDQYVRDYARIYGLRTVVFRQSCIYGTRQFGGEDQGWVAHFCIAARTDRPIVICGDGKQVRDVLWIDDLLALYDHAVSRIDLCAGAVFNVGGGPQSTTSIWAEFGPRLERLAGRSIPVRTAGWRPGDQRVYISDIRKAQKLFDWQPRVTFDDGIERLWAWVDDQHASL
jgi:CDP-paratose 2-epimerase